MKNFAIACFSFGIALGLAFQCHFFQCILVHGILSRLLLPLSLLIGLVILIVWMREEKTERWWDVFKATVIMALSLDVSLLVGYALNRWHLERTLDYVAHAQVVLDDIKRQTGDYPEEWPPELSKDRPYWLRDSHCYGLHSEGVFRIYYYNPIIPVDGSQYYYSDTRIWIDRDGSKARQELEDSTSK